MKNKSKKNKEYRGVWHIVALLPLLFLLVACSTSNGPKGDPVTLHRFEQVLFDTPAADLGERLGAERQTYDSPLINCEPDNPQYMQMLRAFVGDPTMRYVYHKTDSLYHDLSWLEADLGNAMAKARALCPEMVYDRYYTLLTADFENYDTRVFCYNRDLAISIDRYAVGAMDEMNFFGLPEYLVALCSRDFILRDCMAAAAMDHISLPERDLMLLDYIIYSGKILYFLDQVLPETSDEVKLRYTPDQMAWMRQNVKEVWGWMVQKEMLFSTDRLQLRNLTGDAPKTNAFGDGSAPRTGDYIGWQIVSAYMEKNDVSLSELFAETNSQKILEQSGWRPEK